MLAKKLSAAASAVVVIASAIVTAAVIAAAAAAAEDDNEKDYPATTAVTAKNIVTHKKFLLKILPKDFSFRKWLHYILRSMGKCVTS